MAKLKREKQKKKVKTTKAKSEMKVKPEAKKNATVVQKGYTAADLAHFKNIILEKRREILDDLETLRNTVLDVDTGEYIGESTSYSLHMEQGTDAMEREKTFLFAAREGKFLNYLDDALLRIEKGEYGLCLVCGELIEKERLEAVPHTQMCIKCKNKSYKK